MKRFLIFLLLAFVTCKNDGNGSDRNLKTCVNEQQNINFWLMYPWLLNQPQSNNIVIGDSTMFLAAYTPGWRDTATTQSFAVAGNTICNVIQQLSVISTPAPQIIIWGTTGGNSLLHGETAYETGEDGQMLIQLLLARFPSAKLVAIAIHPTKQRKFDHIRHQTNLRIFDSLVSIYPMGQWCWIDPEDLFIGKVDNWMFDNIHYTPLMAMIIKQEIERVCHISF